MYECAAPSQMSRTDQFTYIKDVFELVFFNFSLQYYQNKQQNRSTVLGLISLGGTGCYFGLLKIAACTELLRSGNTAPLLKISQTGQEIPC